MGSSLDTSLMVNQDSAGLRAHSTSWKSPVMCPLGNGNVANDAQVIPE